MMDLLLICRLIVAVVTDAAARLLLLEVVGLGGGAVCIRMKNLGELLASSYSPFLSDDGSGAYFRAGAMGCLWFMTAKDLIFDGGGGTLSRGGEGFWLKSDPLENGVEGGGAVMLLAVLERDAGGGSGVEDRRSTVTEVNYRLRSEWVALSPCWADCFWDPCFGLSGLGLTGWALSHDWQWVGWVLSLFKAWSVFGMGVEGDFSLSSSSMNRVSMAHIIV
ncbi:hypothetical protein RchiOBHm_Chr7g0233151 [Rosa chinensis]|uniref:Uncharacterized protein n=1 Tax=Rosa chinensis TaxID=74649 RepID=A0A2P6PG40_ROSCH|nr:hypothetical protein RchiOBHm_Chr7g0233151 [Rosa chinensis]